MENVKGGTHKDDQKHQKLPELSQELRQESMPVECPKEERGQLSPPGSTYNIFGWTDPLKTPL